MGLQSSCSIICHQKISFYFRGTGSFMSFRGWQRAMPFANP
jgi:hypothetical protein